MHIDTGVLRAELTDCCAKDSWTTERKLIMGFAIKRDLFEVDCFIQMVLILKFVAPQ